MVLVSNHQHVGGQQRLASEVVPISHQARLLVELVDRTVACDLQRVLGDK